MGESVEPAEAAEREWIERARGGDRDAFDHLVSVHLARVWRVVWRIVRHREDTEDVVQEVFLSAYRALPGFRGEARFSTWLHRLAVSRALNHLDRAAERMRRASRPLESPRAENPVEPSPEVEAAHGGLAPTPLRTLEAKERLRRLAECLSRLPAGWRAVIALRDVESMAYDEIAKRLGIALGTVRSRLSRARLTLRDCVEGRTP